MTGGSSPNQPAFSLHSRPVRIGLAVAIAVLSVHLLLPSSLSFRPVAGSGRPTVKSSYFDDYAAEGLPVDMSAPVRPSKPKTAPKPGSVGSHTTKPASGSTSKKGGNTLVLFTTDSSSVINLLSVEAEIVTRGSASIPGLEASHVRSFIPSAWTEYERSTTEMPRESFEKIQGYFQDLAASFSPDAPGVGGFLLGSCEVDLPILNEGLFMLYSALPSSKRFPIACFLKDSSRAALNEATGALVSGSDTWMKKDVLGRWSQTGFLRILVTGSANVPRLRAHLNQISSTYPYNSLGLEYLPIHSYIPSFPLPSTFKAPSWRLSAGGGNGKDGKQPGKDLALMDVVVVDDGLGADGPGGKAYEILFQEFELELSANAAGWGYKPRVGSGPFKPDNDPPATRFDASRSHFHLHLVLPPPSALPWTASPSAAPKPPVVPPALTEFVKIHWDFDASDEAAQVAVGGEGRSSAQRFWDLMGDMDVMLFTSEGSGRLPLSLPLSLSLNLPLVLTPDQHISLLPHLSLRRPYALLDSSAIRVLRHDASAGVDLGDHWMLRKELGALLKRGWKWESDVELIEEWRNENWQRFVDSFDPLPI